MAEIDLKSLDERLRKQIGKASAAMERGDHDYARDICHRILHRHPECLPLRKLLHRARMPLRTKEKPFRRFLRRASSLPLLCRGLAQVEKNPRLALRAAEKILSRDPLDKSALRLLAKGARAWGLLETEAYALESMRSLKPEKIRDLLDLGNVYLKLKRGVEAEKVGDAVLSIDPSCAEAHELVKKASVAQSMPQYSRPE